jgi:hypothetical protein
MRRAVIRTRIAHAGLVAAAIEPDDTPEMATTVEGGVVETTVERETTGGLRTTVDDYARNLAVAARLVRTVLDGADASGADVPTGEAIDDGETDEEATGEETTTGDGTTDGKRNNRTTRDDTTHDTP